MIQIDHLARTEAMRFKNIRLRSLKENPEAFGTTFEAASSWDDSSWTSQVETLNTFVATLDGADVGVARAALDGDGSATAWLISMWVAPEARGKKVGDTLARAILEWARRNGVKNLKLDVVDTNHAAISLYESHGFVKNGITGSLPAPRAHITEHQRVLKF